MIDIHHRTSRTTDLCLLVESHIVSSPPNLELRNVHTVCPMYYTMTTTYRRRRCKRFDSRRVPTFFRNKCLQTVDRHLDLLGLPSTSLGFFQKLFCLLSRSRRPDHCIMMNRARSVQRSQRARCCRFLTIFFCKVKLPAKRGASARGGNHLRLLTLQLSN